VAIDVPSHFCCDHAGTGFAQLCVLCVIVKPIWLQEGFLPALRAELFGSDACSGPFTPEINIYSLAGFYILPLNAF